MRYMQNYNFKKCYIAILVLNILTDDSVIDKKNHNFILSYTFSNKLFLEVN